MNKRGSLGSIFAVLLIVAIVLAIVTAATGSGSAFSQTMEQLPDAVITVVEIYQTIFAPIFKGIYFLVAPESLDQDGKMIALGIFLLLWLVGGHTLKPLFKNNTFLAGLVAAIVGLIASRSLTDKILKETALSASPIAAAAFLVGILPILMVNGMVNKWFVKSSFGPQSGSSKAKSTKSILMKSAVWGILGAIYLFVFWTIFEAQTLGWVYFIGILIFAVGDVIFPAIRQKAFEEESKDIGRFGNWLANVLARAKLAGQGAQEAQTDTGRTGE